SARPLSTAQFTPQKPVLSAAEDSFAVLAAELSAYLSEADVKRVRDAYRFADEAHLGQFRASGEPYITHPVAVARQCAQWRLDAPALMAALMHDTMEDRGVTKAELVERFGAAVADLVDGLSKLDKLKFNSLEESQAESFRKMLLAMSRDVRVILIKLADRLHNMATLGAVDATKRKRIARETLEIYAQIAHRLGLNQIYRELQDLSFRHLHPMRYAVLSRAVRAARGNRRELVSKIESSVKQAFAKQQIPVQLHGREKTLYSIYRKMREKHLTFSEVLDIYGFRVVVDEPLECYRALGVLHQLYKPITDKFKDYIAIPKTNGYQSLHTTLQGPYGTPVEFQVRTPAMHHLAESGIAAHWLYKARDAQKDSVSQAQSAAAAMLQSLLEIAGEARDPNEFFEHVKVGLASEAVYVFTPAGEIIALPRGATPVDFAYMIHSDVGHRCIAATVNTAPVPLKTELHSGDVVRIDTAPFPKPNPEWLSFVKTARARTAIRHFLRNSSELDTQALGERLFLQSLQSVGLAPGALHDDDWESLFKLTAHKSREGIYGDIGLGKLAAPILVSHLMAHRSMERAVPQPGTTVLLDGSEGGSVRYATCCRPLPGDEVIGHMGRGEGLTVHVLDCATARRLFQRSPEAWIDVRWADEIARPFETAIVVRVDNTKGALAKVSSAISVADADIVHVAMGETRSERTTDLQFLLTVRDTEHLDEVFRRLHNTPIVLSAWRVKPGQ
ncbi:MAG: bifunctional (p)ppGpp synthetase/guanosine-3',5'-bis(diphosphate) 3'-pyrophosphohydrolase, partial [Betaproteobacteria bacterium]|nr:bifunctional (p)ppGpp synthetase/guanosine-3',5'-bis(diphosphate) 3'-pyrophosphohydrolase [Betaproteobacteria bacterium]